MDLGVTVTTNTVRHGTHDNDVHSRSDNRGWKIEAKLLRCAGGGC